MLEDQSLIKAHKVIIVSLFKDSNKLNAEKHLNELERLVNTLGGSVIQRVVQYKKSIDAKYYIGKGKLKQLYNFCSEVKCDYIVFNNDISPSHMKNIQAFFDKKVLIKDRVGVILDIFAKHARTKESKTQIKLAKLEYLLPRLTRQWTHLERQMGGTGTRGGPGETQIEIDRRLIRNQIIKLKKDLNKISKIRNTQKSNRKNIYKVSLVGYTNAGKSTIMQSLSSKKTYIKDELFATLDTSTKKITIDKSNNFLISDTVGFIRNLPDNLIASFRSTLSEIIDCNLLLKVIDASSDEYLNHISSIDTVLEYLDILSKDYIIVFNKIDLIKNNNILINLKKKYPNAVFVQSTKRDNMKFILDEVKKMMNHNFVLETIKLPYEKYFLIDEIYKKFEVISREENKNNVILKLSGERKNLNNLINLIN